MDEADLQLRMNVTVRGRTARVILDAAESTHLAPATVAKSMLAQLAEQSDPDSARVTELLNRIPGAWERIALGREQARRGETIALDEL